MFQALSERVSALGTIANSVRTLLSRGLSRGGIAFVASAVAAAALGIASPVSAQCGPTWNTTIGVPGTSTSGVITSLGVLPDGDLIVGGTFTSIGGVAASNIARYNPTSGVWSSLGSGVAGPVFALTVVPPGVTNAGDVIVGGNFFTAGGVTVQKVARYTPSSNTWFNIPGGNGGDVRAITVIPSGVSGAGDVIFGGFFSSAGNIPSNPFGMARWNPATGVWSTCGAGSAAGVNGTVLSLAVIPAGLSGAGEVIVGGDFGYAGATPTTTTTARIARYRPATNDWVSAGGGLPLGASGSVRSIAILPSTYSTAGIMLVGGEFSAVANGTVAAANIAFYTRSNNTWSPLPAGTNGGVQAMAIGPSNEVYAVGSFTSAGGVDTTSGIAKLNVNNLLWSSVGNGSVNGATAVAVVNNTDVIVGGNFASASGFSANDIARYFTGTGPVITSQVGSRSVCAGGSTTFSVGASGSNLTYQWRRNGSNISAATNASAVTPSLTLTNVQSANTGTYDCVVTSTCSVISNAATLSLNTAVSITQAPVGSQVCAGSTAQISVTATGTGLTYQWQFQNANINAATNPSAATSTLSISNFQAANAGSYRCVVTGACNSVTSGSATISLPATVNIVQQPTSTTFCSNTTGSLTVQATGAVQYIWRRNITPLTNGATYSGVNTATLTILAPNAGNTGVNNPYNCVIIDACGNQTVTNTVNFLLNVAPSITSQPVSVVACTGGVVSFTVAATGTPVPTYQWRRGTTNITNAPGISGANSATLLITSAQAAGVGSDYNCVITNPCGSVTTSNVGYTLNPSVVINQNPSPVTACAGTTASFSVQATGPGTLTYIWRRNGVNLNVAQNPSAATPTLVLSNVQSSINGSYDCVVTSSTCPNNPRTSLAAQLTVSSCVCNPADIACDDGIPLINAPGCVNSNLSPNEGDYNAFFAADGFFFQSGRGAAAIGSFCDIACDDGLPPTQSPICVNNGVNEGDYNCFFNNLFLPCP